MDSSRPSINIQRLAGGLSLLSWVGLIGLAGYAATATAARLACEFRYPDGARCDATRDQWDAAMQRTGAGFVLLFAHSPGEGGARALVERFSASRRREDEAQPDLIGDAVGFIAEHADDLAALAGVVADPREAFLPRASKWAPDSLPPGWTRDDAGHLRDATGRYASEQAAADYWRDQ